MPKDAAKMPESAWKLVFYTMSWSYSTYLLFFTSYSFFHDPPSVFYSKRHTPTPHPPPLCCSLGGTRAETGSPGPSSQNRSCE